MPAPHPPRPDPDGPTFRTRSNVHFYGHFVWAARARTPQMNPDMERAAHRCVHTEATALGCRVLGVDAPVGGMPDHIHLFVRLPATIAVSQIAKQLKGVSSRLLNTLRPEFSERFSWQDGYGFFSVGQSEDEQAAILTYVRDQKRHHATGEIWPAWEEITMFVAVADEETGS